MLHASLQCIQEHPHPVRNQTVRWITDDALVEDFDKFSIDQGYVEVDAMVENYKQFYLNCWTNMLH